MRKATLALLVLFLGAPGSEAQTAEQIGQVAQTLTLAYHMMPVLALLLALAAWFTRRTD